MNHMPPAASDYYSYPLHLTGYASPLGAVPDVDVVQRLHDVVREVTGKAVEQPAKPRMGFLP